MNRRDTVLSILDTAKPQETIPAGFFIHFGEDYHRGPEAVDKHLEFFRYTGMDFVKIQYESEFPPIPDIQKPEDWAKMPLYRKDFYQDPLDVAAGLIKAAKKEALVIMTLYSPFMCARATAGEQMITDHIRQNPEAVKKGMEIITESMMFFVKGCIELGIDGFYHSSQGGESDRFEDPALFDACIKPYDLTLMEEINQSCIFNILHVCDFRGPYDDLTPFLDYPGHVVNFSHELGAKKITGKEVSRLFNRPFMGGLDRKGIIATGTAEQIRERVRSVIDDAPERFILGADCTLPNDVSWDNIRTAISAAHEYRRST